MYFDTLAVVNGGRTEPEKVSTDWVHENMLERCTDIEAAAALGETFALADAMRTLEGAGGAPTAEAVRSARCRFLLWVSRATAEDSVPAAGTMSRSTLRRRPVKLGWRL